jgi:hypothetical protein
MIIKVESALIIKLENSKTPKIVIIKDHPTFQDFIDRHIYGKDISKSKITSIVKVHSILGWKKISSIKKVEKLIDLTFEHNSKSLKPGFDIWLPFPNHILKDPYKVQALDSRGKDLEELNWGKLVITLEKKGKGGSKLICKNRDLSINSKIGKQINDSVKGIYLILEANHIHAATL